MSYPTNRRSARTLVGDFVHTACAKLTLSACPPAIMHDLKVQLRVFRSIAIAMKWDDLTKKIDRALGPPDPPIPELTKEQRDAHSWAQANDSSPEFYKP